MPKICPCCGNYETEESLARLDRANAMAMLYENGMPLHKIATKFQASISTANKQIRAIGTRIRKRGRYYDESA